MTAAPSVSTPALARAFGGALFATAIDIVLLAFALGGFAALAHHPRALALVVVWALGALALAWLRPLRGHDAVTVDRDPPALLLALLLLALASGPVAAFGESHHLAPMDAGEWLRWTGVALAACGLGVRIAAMAQLGPRFSPLVSLQREHALETHGLYARVRHPGYAGAWIAALGAALAFASALALPLVAAFGLCLWARARREEGLLERQFGDAYRAYRARSGRFFPRFG